MFEHRGTFSIKVVFTSTLTLVLNVQIQNIFVASCAKKLTFSNVNYIHITSKKIMKNDVLLKN